MRSRDLLAALVLTGLCAGAAAFVIVRGDAFLPRHPATGDIPWCRAEGAPAFAGEPVNRAFSDKINLLYPDHVLLHRELSKGRLPLWNPWILSGVSQAANPLAGVFYPPNWFLALFPVLHGPVIAAALHVLLGGLFLLLFLRVAGVGPGAALFGALAWSWSGWTAAHLHNTPLVAVMVWIPLGWAAIEARARGRGRGWLVVLAIAMALMWLAGFPQFAVYGSGALALQAILAIVARARRDGPAAGAAEAGRLGAAVIAGLLLAGPQIGAVIEGLPDSGHHGSTRESLVSERFRGPALLGLVLPTVIGDPGERGDWRDHWGARTVLGEGPEHLAPAVMNWSERTLYPGILVVVLAIAAIPTIRTRPAGALALIATAGLSLATIPLLIGALAPLPVFAFGAPARAVCLLALTLPALAAIGLDWRLRTGKTASQRGRWRFVAVVAAVPAFITVLAFAAETTFVEAVVWSLRAAGMEERFGVQDPLPLSGYVEAFRPLALALRTDLLRLALVSGLGASAWYGLRHRAALRVAAVSSIVVLDLGTYFVSVNRPVSAASLFETTPGIAFLREHLGDRRFIRVSRDREAAQSDRDRLLLPNLGILYGLPDAQGYREQVPQAYPALWTGVASQTAVVGIAGITADQADSPLLDLLRVKYLIASEPIAALASRMVFPEVGADRADLWIYENPDPLPRAWIVHSWRQAPAEEIRGLVRSGRVDPGFELLFEPDRTLPVALAEGPRNVLDPGNAVSILGESSDGVSPAVRVRVTEPGLLVFPDAWARGWVAEVMRDGVASTPPVLAAFTCLRAVEVQAGDQTVTLRYRPAGVVVGTWCAAGGLVLVGLLAVRLRRSAVVVPDAAPSSSADLGDHS